MERCQAKTTRLGGTFGKAKQKKSPLSLDLAKHLEIIIFAFKICAIILVMAVHDFKYQHLGDRQTDL